MDILVDQNVVNQNKKIEEKPRSVKDKSVWDELKEFWDELWELIYIDMKNSYLFITENKNYFICTVILAFLLQFTNVSNLGTSFEKYCQKGKDVNQNGGASVVAKAVGPSSVSEIRKDLTYRSLKDGQSMLEQQAKYNKKKADEDAKSDTDKYGKSKMSSRKAFTSDMKEKKLQEEESKANQKRISFFENIKNKLGKGGSWGGEYGVLGPVFGNMEKIMDSVKTIFYIITILLTIAGIISIPVLIFLIITYMIIKSLVGRFTVL